MGKILFGHFRIFLLAALSLVVFLGKSYETSMRGVDSNIHATVAMNVTSHGVLPLLPIPHPNPPSWRTPDQPMLQGKFNDHPFFYFYLNGWIMRLLGPNAWSARILTAMLGTACVLLTAFFGSLLRSQALGFSAAIILLTSRPFALSAGAFSLDPPQVFFTLLPMVLWWQKKWIWMGVTAGVGLWIKTPVVLLVYPTAFLVCLFNQEERHNLLKMIWAGVLSLAIGSLVWIAAGMIGGWPMVTDYWLRQFLGTAVEGRASSQGHDPWMLLRFIYQQYLPWWVLLGLSVPLAIKKRELLKPYVFIPAVAVILLVLSVNSIRFKFDYYYLPAFPFLALLSAYSIAHWVERYESQFYKGFYYFVPAMLTLLLVTPIPLAPEPFPAIRKFIPFIQLDQNCQRKILVIRGHEPFASAHNYVFLLNFYTGKQVITTTCESAAKDAEDPSIGWVITSSENLRRCLSPISLKRLSSNYLFGTQHLLADGDISTHPVDLTPLVGELQAVTDCKPQPYLHDRYHSYQ